eukprot:12354992-Alexandrium_andersonii.AAC.1
MFGSITPELSFLASAPLKSESQTLEPRTRLPPPGLPPFGLPTCRLPLALSSARWRWTRNALRFALGGIRKRPD